MPSLVGLRVGTLAKGKHLGRFLSLSLFSRSGGGERAHGRRFGTNGAAALIQFWPYDSEFNGRNVGCNACAALAATAASTTQLLLATSMVGSSGQCLYVRVCVPCLLAAAKATLVGATAGPARFHPDGLSHKMTSEHTKPCVSIATTPTFRTTESRRPLNVWHLLPTRGW